MANFTKKAITASFLSLLQKNRFNKITVAMICEDCGISRRTFYNHFEDLYALLDYIIESEVDTVLKSNKTKDAEKVAETLVAFGKVAADNKKAIYNLFDSMDGEEFRSYVKKMAEAFVESFTGEAENDFGQIRQHFYTLGVKSFLMEWLRSGMDTSPEDMALALRMILESSDLYSKEHQEEAQ